MTFPLCEGMNIYWSQSFLPLKSALCRSVDGKRKLDDHDASLDERLLFVVAVVAVVVVPN